MDQIPHVLTFIGRIPYSLAFIGWIKMGP